MNVKQSFLRPWWGPCLLLLTLLAGCQRIPLGSLWALRGLQAAEVDPAALRAVLYLPPGVGLGPDGLTVRVSVARAGEHPEQRELLLALQPQQGEGARHVLNAPRPRGHWLVLALPAEAQARLVALRREVAQWRQPDGTPAKRTLALSAALQACRLAEFDPLPAAQTVDAWLRWKPGQEDLRLLDGALLSELQPEGAPAALPRC